MATVQALRNKCLPRSSAEVPGRLGQGFLTFTAAGHGLSGPFWERGNSHGAEGGLWRQAHRSHPSVFSCAKLRWETKKTATSLSHRKGN